MPAAADTRNLDGDTRAFYCDALEVMNRAGVPFLIGGAYAFGLYTGIERHTKDFDLFLLPQDCEAALRAFAEVGYQTELSYPHWLGKVFYKDAFVDLIPRVHHRLDRDDVARLDGQPRRLFRIEPAPLHVLGRGFEPVLLRRARRIDSQEGYESEGNDNFDVGHRCPPDRPYAAAIKPSTTPRAMG